MSGVILTVAIAAIIVGSGVAMAPMAVAEMRGYVVLLALVNLLLANAIVWIIIFWT